MPSSVLDTALVVRWLNLMADAVDRETSYLTELDSPIGDADHGTNMQRGFSAVRQGLEQDSPATPGAVLLLAGRLLVSKVGGASGPLYGTLLRRTGKALGDGEEASGDQFAGALRTGVDAVRQLGGAVPGDKTMVDALEPAVAAVEEAVSSGAELGEALARARTAADQGATATVPLRARKGRASYLGERSEGHQDPGATSTGLLFAALAQAVADE